MGQDGNRAGRVAYLFGGDAQTGRVVAGGGNVLNSGSTDIRYLRNGDQNDFLRIHVPGNFQRMKVRPSLADIRIILNMITDPDLNPKVLSHADQFLKPFRGKVLNRPQAVLKSSRDYVALLLDGIDGLVVPRVARFRGHPPLVARAIEKAAIRFPAIVRKTGKHDGDVIGVVASLEEVVARVDAREHYFLTEFVELRSDDRGLYHKIRVFFFGQRPVVRHRLVSDHWNVHAPDRARFLAHRPEAIALERALIEEGLDALPPIARAAIVEVRARMPLDYFGIDFAVMHDGRALLFEANATMNFFPIAFDPPFPYFATTLAQAKQAFNAMIADED